VSKPSDDDSQVKDYFGTFLETVKQASPDYPETSSSAQSGLPTDVSAISVLVTLASNGEAMPLTTLLTKLGISALQSGSVLSPLIESKFVSITGAPGSETVALTPDGARLTSAKA
jgi:hypothetical protein